MKRVVAFDSLRFFAAIFIVLFHALGPLFPKTSTFPYFRLARLCVEIFFVLSGFLLAQTYQKMKDVPMLPIRKCTLYFFHRIKRLYPEYLFACILWLTVFYFSGVKYKLEPFFLNIFMSSAWGGIPKIGRAHV